MEIKNREKTLLMAAGLGLALLVGDSLVLSPLTSSWKARSEHIAELRKQVDEGTRVLKREAAVNYRWEAMRTNTLPSNVSAAEAQMLKSFASWEQESGITRVSIKPQWKQADDNYSTLDCRADYTGDIEKLTRFLYDVEKGPLGVKVDSVEISSRDDNGQQLTLGLQVSGLLLTTNQPAQP